MAEVLKSRQIWFGAFIVSGVLLGLVLLVQTVATYVYVSGNLVTEAALNESERKALSLQRSIRRIDTSDTEALASVIEDALIDWQETIGWVRILDRTGRVLAEGGATENQEEVLESLRDRIVAAFTETAASQESETTPQEAGGRGGAGRGGPGGGTGAGAGAGALGLGDPYYEIRPSGGGSVLVRLVQVRQVIRPGIRPGGAAAPMWIEIAVDLSTVSASFSPLRRNLIIGVLASFALLGTVVLLSVRFPHYLRGKQLEGQMELARAVQGNLMPAPAPEFRHAEIAADCTPVSQIGGDFYDIFDLPGEALGLSLGDVSGKGVSAAPLMGFIHGAAHASSWTDSPRDHEMASARLNNLLYKKTATDRFVTLFWAYFEPGTSLLRYVNAGHCPPVLFRARTQGNELARLEAGGPVLGAFPDATYVQTAVPVEDGDVLVMFSDGIVEATNASREDFGEARILSAVRKRWNGPVAGIRDGILADLAEFRSGALANDDQTLVVVRFRPQPMKASDAGEPATAVSAV